MTAFYLYGSLFLSSFLSATLLPGSSEALLVGYVATETGTVWILVAVALIGNVLGAAVNWILGYYFAHFKDRKWFPITHKHYEAASLWFNRYGKWSLLLAWLPIIGDPLTIVAGALKIPFGIFLLLVSIGKFARYLIIAQAALIVMN